MRCRFLVATAALLATACCVSSSPSAPAPPPAAPPPSSPEQPILSPGACHGDDRAGVPLATSDFVSTLPLEPARARLDDWNEWCPDTWCEGSLNWYAYDLRSDASRSEITLRTYSLQRASVADVTDVEVTGHGFHGRVLAQHVVPECIVPCLQDGVYEPTRSTCLVLDVRLSLELPVPVEPIPITSRWDETLAEAGRALEEALRARVPEDLGRE